MIKRKVDFMLFSRTKFFKSVLVSILVLSLIGSLSVFRGFSLDEGEENSESPSIIVADNEASIKNDAEESSNEKDGCVDSAAGAENNEAVYSGLPGESEENPIVINSVEDLEDFAAALEAGNTFEGKFFEIGNDIVVPEDNKFFSDRLSENGILFLGEFAGHIKSSNGNFISIYVEEMPEEIFLFEKLGEEAAVCLINLNLFSENTVGIYTFSRC